MQLKVLSDQIFKIGTLQEIFLNRNAVDRICFCDKITKANVLYVKMATQTL